MKKILSGLMLLLASFSLIIIGSNQVFAAENDDIEKQFENLFIDDSEYVEFEILTKNNDDASVTPGTYDLLDNLITTKGEIKIPINYGQNERLLVRTTLTINNNFPIDVELFKNDFDNIVLMSNDGSAYFLYGLDNNDNNNTIIGFDLGDIVRIGEKALIPFNNYYDYGKIRNYDRVIIGDQPNNYSLNLNDNNQVFILNDNGGKQIANNDIKSSFFATSIYKNFKIETSSDKFVVLDVENVAGVYLDAHNGTSDITEPSTFYVYYYDDEDLYLETYEIAGIPQNSNQVYHAYFYGGVREAISGKENFIANVDELVDLSDFLEYIEAWDDIDGDISDQVFIEDDGGYQNDVVGVYEITFGVTDSENQTSYLEVKVHVVDITKPVITGTNSDVQISYTSEFNISSWVNGLTVTDNYYDNLSITIKENTYSINKNRPGKYHVTVQAKDGSNNIGTFTRNIEVVDDVGPVFSGIKSITTSITENINVAEILQGIAAIDAIDGNVSESITIDSDTLTGNANLPGEYEVVFKATDEAGNDSFLTVDVSIHSAPPGFYVVNGSSIRLLPGSNLTIEQILDILGIEDATEVSTNYTEESAPGVYPLSFKSGDEEYNINITVLGANDPGLPPAIIPDANTFNWAGLALGIFAVIGVVSFTVIALNKKK